MTNLSWFKCTKDNIDSIPNESGVYIISAQMKNDDYKAFYVGQASDLKSRIAQHFSTSENNQKLKEFLSNSYYFKISFAQAEKFQLDALEKYLISYYDPQFNNNEGNGNVSEPCSLPNVVK